MSPFLGFKSKAPTGLKALRAATSEFVESKSDEIGIRVLIDRSCDAAFAAYAQKMLFPLSDKVRVYVSGYSGALDLSLDACEADIPVSLVIVLSGACAHTLELLAALRLLSADVVCIATDPSVFAECLDDDGLAKSLADVIMSPEGEPYEAAFAQLASWIAERLEGSRVALAQAYPFLRHSCAAAMTRQMSFTNALVATAFFLPGADMPLLTFNQIRLAMQIAALHGLPLGMARLSELAAVVGIGACSRALARVAASRIGRLGFLLRPGLAFAATSAIGIAAEEFYSRKDEALGEALGGTLGEASLSGGAQGRQGLGALPL
jgi:uncharacterized protein (DUF697 family)